MSEFCFGYLIYFLCIYPLQPLMSFDYVFINMNKMCGVCVWDLHPEVGGGEAVRGGDVGGGSGVRVEGINVGQQGAHHSRNTGTHVFRRETCKMSGENQIYWGGFNMDLKFILKKKKDM